MKSLDEYIKQATNNVTEDRAAVKALLMNLMKYMNVSDDRHKEVGLIAAKYLETLQRSNEQLVKVAALVLKQEGPVVGISDEDKDDLFDMIQNGPEQDNGKV